MSYSRSTHDKRPGADGDPVLGYDAAAYESRRSCFSASLTSATLHDCCSCRRRHGSQWQNREGRVCALVDESTGGRRGLERRWCAHDSACVTVDGGCRVCDRAPVRGGESRHRWCVFAGVVDDMERHLGKLSLIGTDEALRKHMEDMRFERDGLQREIVRLEEDRELAQREFAMLQVLCSVR